MIPHYFIKVITKRITPKKLEINIEGDTFITNFFEDKDKLVCRINGTTMNIYTFGKEEYMIEQSVVTELKIDVGGIQNEI